ncbi:MAG TPA: hypothetical protein VMU39_09110 [Solirubrobacteraceae bacterium]|nr:hypothetical protein [Solirubrobacteraceae bacterium]
MRGNTSTGPSDGTVTIHPHIAIEPSVNQVTVAAGHSVSLQVTIDRIEITSAVTISAQGLPMGVSAQFSPASLPASTLASSSATVTLTLTASGSAPAAGTRFRVVAGTAFAAIVITVTSPFSHINGAPTVSIGSSGVSAVTSPVGITLAAFGSAKTPMNVEVAAGVSGTVSFAVAGALPSGVSAQFQPMTLQATGQAGGFGVEIVLNAGANVTPSSSNVTVNISLGGALRGSLTFRLLIVAPTVTAVQPPSGAVPMLGNPGTAITIRGRGFGPGTTVTFGADAPVAASFVAPDGTSLVVNVPATAASGQLTVTSPAGAAPGAPEFAVDTYRNTRGFSWVNSDSFQNMVGGSYSFSDAVALFGSSATHISGFGITVDNPLVSVFLKAAGALLGSNGQCFGMCLGSFRFSAGQRSIAGLPTQPASAEPNGPNGPDVWLLDGPPLGAGSNVSPALSAFVHQQHLAQLSQESINNWVGFHATVTSASGLRNALLSAFNTGGRNMGAMVALNPSIGEGHVVVAYDVVDRGGDFDILLYNPNLPFDASEDGTASTRQTSASQNVINVMSDGSWVLAHSDASFGPGTADWRGGIFNITVIPWTAIPVQPSIPWAEMAALGAVFMWIVGGDAEVAQVSDGAGHVLLADGEWNTDAATRLPGVRPMPALGGLGKASTPAYVGNTQAPLLQTIVGHGEGTYEVQWVAGGTAVTLDGVPTRPGSSDTVLIHGGRVDFTAAEKKAVNTTVVAIGADSGRPRTATLKTTGSAGAAVSLAFDPVAETFAYTHGGEAATYSLELSTIDAQGKLVSHSTGEATITDSETHTFRPDWDRLSAGVGLVDLHLPAQGFSHRPL